MGTKKIRQALKLIDLDHPNMPPSARAAAVAAMAEVEAIEMAARSLYETDGLQVLRNADFEVVPDLFEAIAKEREGRS